MALVIYGEFVVGMSGSVGGTTHARNKGGTYVKNKGIPTNPQTILQSAVRGKMSSIATSWKNLTEIQRTGWNASAKDFPYSNKLGEQKFYSGFGLFTKLNLNLMTSGASTTILADAPAPVTLSPITTGTLTIENALGVPDIYELDTLGVLAATDSLIINCTNSKSAGITSANQTPFLLRSTATGTIDLTTAFSALYGPAVLASKIFAQVFVMNSTTGQRNFAGSTSVIVSGD